MSLNFTKNDLKAFAGSTVFNRGINYFQDGAVDEIKTVVDKYTAKVYGSVVYSVEYAPDENTFSCNCPYDGFCKHSVAFGLMLLDSKEVLTTPESFENWYNRISDEIKFRFLERLIRNDLSLREKLDRISQQKNHPVDINDIADAVYHSLDALSYDDIWENHSGYDYYVDEYEVVDNLVSATLDNYMSEVEERILTGKFDQAFEYILGIYIGLKRSAKTEIGDYCDDLEGFLYPTYLHFTESLRQQPDDFKLKIFNGFMAFCKKHQVGNFSFFKDLLLLFVTKKHSDTLKEFLINYYSDYMAKEILMQIARFKGDTVLMEKILESGAPASLYIAYLNVLKTNGEFEKIKNILLKFAGDHDICVLDHYVIPELGKETYKDLLQILVEKCFKLEHYKKYEQLLTRDEKQKFLSGIINNISYSHEAYALQILFYEKAYERVLKIIEGNTHREYSFDSYDEYLKEIAKTMSGRVWEIYFKRVDFLFGERKRSAYSAMTHNLKIMKGIDREKTEQLILAYYNQKPRKPALKDEFNLAGIV